MSLKEQQEKILSQLISRDSPFRWDNTNRYRDCECFEFLSHSKGKLLFVGLRTRIGRDRRKARR